MILRRKCLNWKYGPCKNSKIKIKFNLFVFVVFQVIFILFVVKNLEDFKVQQASADYLLEIYRKMREEEYVIFY